MLRRTLFAPAIIQSLKTTMGTGPLLFQALSPPKAASMILKQTPEDFQVEELTDLEPSKGPFSLYRLEKSGWTTPDALQAIRRRWRLDHRRLAYGGLKDRHAQTVQYFTVFHGPQRRLTHQGFTVAYLGQVAEPFHAENIRANHFQLILRDVS